MAWINSKKSKRKKAHGHVRKPLFGQRRFVVLAFMCIVLGFGAIFTGSFMIASWPNIVVSTEEFIAKKIDARVKTIMVAGVEHVAPAALKESLGLKRGTSLVGFDAQAARQRIQALDWVRSASVVRVLPSTVKVDIQEHTPLARLDQGGKVWVMADDGRLITPEQEGFESLPVLRGAGAENNARGLFEVLAQHPEMAKKVVGAVFVGERRWDVEFLEGSAVKLPQEHTSQALAYLGVLQQERQVLDVPGVVVDLRIQDRIVLRLPVGANKKLL